MMWSGSLFSSMGSPPIIGLTWRPAVSGFLLGDGRLNYGTENIVEAYYLWKIRTWVSLTLDMQGIQNPGYNRDRGPAASRALRVHLEF